MTDSSITNKTDRHWRYPDDRQTTAPLTPQKDSTVINTTDRGRFAVDQRISEIIC